MPVLESIREAELKAQTLIDEANSNVKDILEKEKELALVEASKLKNDVEITLNELKEETKAIIHDKELAIKNETSKMNELNKITAQKNMNSATLFIVKKVFDA